jgi:P27 family predicted phage terminase small subunit
MNASSRMISQRKIAPIVLFFKLTSSATYGWRGGRDPLSRNLEDEKLMRGRKPLPSNVVRLRGNPGKRRLNDAEPRPAPKVPACPACLGDNARKEWKRLAKELAELGLLTRLDRGLLAAYCQAHALWVEAVSSIERYGTMIKSPNGHPMQSPYVAVVNKQVEIMGRIAAEFGMTPSSRSRIRAGAPVPEDPFEHFLERGRG